LNTKDFGLPQNRERIFIIGIRDDEDNNFNFPKEIPLELKLKDILQDNSNSKYYLSDEQYKKMQTRNRYGDHIIEKDDHIHPCLCAIGKSDVGVIDENNYIKFEVKSHSLYPRSSKTGKGGTGHLTKEDGTSYCLDTGNNQAIEKNKKIRRLTPIECERLQGFPDNFTEGVSDTQRYKQMGNTITVNVIQAIIKNLIK
jgi:DNA (cytosine-5)-methyltransferase 1